MGGGGGAWQEEGVVGGQGGAGPGLSSPATSSLQHGDSRDSLLPTLQTGTDMSDGIMFSLVTPLLTDPAQPLIAVSFVIESVR